MVTSVSRSIWEIRIVNPDEFVKAYMESQDINEFRNTVAELKDDDDSVSRNDNSGSCRKTRADLEAESETYVQDLKQKDMQIAELEIQIASLQNANSKLKAKLAPNEADANKEENSILMF